MGTTPPNGHETTDGATGGGTALREGDAAPAFDMPASGGRRVSLQDLSGRPFILYFYPKADTPGCTKEACGFEEALGALGAVGGKTGITVIGVSKDPIKAIEAFAAKYNLNFPLASDEGGDVVERYGSWGEKSMYGRTYMGIDRSTFLVDANGRIARAWRKVSVTGHVAEVMKAAASLG